MRLSLLALLFAFGCGEEDPVETTDTRPAGKAKTKSKGKGKGKGPAVDPLIDPDAEEPAPVSKAVGERASAEVVADPASETAPADPAAGQTGAARFRSLTATSRFADAIPDLAEAAGSDASLWPLVRGAASGEHGAAALSKLGDAPEGAAADEFHWTQGSLSILSGSPSDALQSAAALTESNEELGRALTAWAAAEGARVRSSGLDATKPADALVLAAGSPASRRADLLKDASSLSSWQAKAVAGMVLAEADPDAASALLDAAKGAGTEAALTVALVRAKSATNSTDAATSLEAAAKAASDLGAGDQASALSIAAMTAHMQASDPTAAWTFGQQAVAARVAATDHRGAVEVGTVAIQAGLEAGEPMEALELARTVLQQGAWSGDADLKATAALHHALVGFALGSAPQIDITSAHQSDATAPVAEGLRGILIGSPDPQAFSGSDVEGLAGVHLQLAGARAAMSSGQSPNAFLDRAVTLADATGIPSAQLNARLERERVLRDLGANTDGALASLTQLAEDLELTEGPLAAEIEARRAMGGGTATMPADAPADWLALTDLTAAAPSGTEGLAGVAQARRKAVAGDLGPALDAYTEALAALPVHHRGPWAPSSVLLGSAGADLPGDFAVLKGTTPEGSMAMLAVHDWYHATRAVDRAFDLGDDPSLALQPLDRASYHDAHQDLQSDSVLWLLGAIEDTSASAAAVAELDAKHLEYAPFARALPPSMPDYRAIHDGLSGTAFLSIRLQGEHGEMVVLSDEGARVAAFEDPKRIQALADSIRADLYAEEPKSVIRQGDQLRVALLEPFHTELTGVARYQVLPDGALWGIPLGVMPENASGMRFLADIRTIAYASTTGEAVLHTPELKRFRNEFLGLSVLSEADAKNAMGDQIATEVENVGRHFEPTLRAVFNGTEATAETFAEKAPNSRFIHLAAVEAGPNGGIGFKDGPMDLAWLRTLQLNGPTVVISTAVEPAISRRWAETLRAAGAGSVVTTAWDTPLPARSKYLFTYYEAVLQHGSPSRALLQARQTLRQEQELLVDPADAGNPGWWAQYTLHGQAKN
jgi:hypothetical protein